MTLAAIVVPALCETDPFEDDKEYGDAHLIVVEIVKLMAGLSIIEEFPNALNHAFEFLALLKTFTSFYRAALVEPV